ncbi:hypothetical protein [Ammoniphilus sp. 3BR4]
MKTWMIGLFLFGLLIMGQVQDTSHFALDFTSTVQPDDLPPRH